MAFINQDRKTSIQSDRLNLKQTPADIWEYSDSDKDSTPTVSLKETWKLADYYDKTEFDNFFIGTVQSFAMSSAPTGWLKCNGAAISRTTYADLFSAIGTTFGVGDGSTTFNLPDLRGEFIRGWDDGRGVDTGRVFGSFQDHSLQYHTHYHASSTDDHYHGLDNFQTTDVNSSWRNAGILNYGTGNFSAETRPRNKALLYCIKY